MQQNENHGLNSLVHIADPFFDYLIFFLHMFITCYLTLLLYFAVRPAADGTICIFSFFLDWNLIAFLTLPFMNHSKKFLRRPASLLLGVLIFIILMILIIHLSQNNILTTVVEGIRNYKPIFIRPFWS